MALLRIVSMKRCVVGDRRRYRRAYFCDADALVVHEHVVRFAVTFDDEAATTITVIANGIQQFH